MPRSIPNLRQKINLFYCRLYKYICAGLNALVLSNATTQATLDGLKGSSEKAVGNWLNFDHYRFSCGKIRAVGLMLIVR